VLHAQIVAALETLGSGREDEQVDRLAQHAFRGEVWDKTLTYCRRHNMNRYSHTCAQRNRLPKGWQINAVWEPCTAVSPIRSGLCRTTKRRWPTGSAFTP
jgi:hypothetical protein